MKITVEISDEKVTGLLHGHSGSYSPWLHEASGEWNSDAGFRVKFDRETDDEGDGRGRMTIKRPAVVRGLAKFARECPRRFASCMEENDDDIDFDCAMQYIIFGKLVYG